MDNLIVKLFTDSVKQRLGDGYEVSTTTVLKNNDTKLTGIIIKESGTNIFPTIYLDDLAEAYQDGYSLDYCIDKILQLYEEHKCTTSFDTSDFLSFSSIKDRIYFTLVNTDKNKERLLSIPHLEIMDLSIIFKVLVNSNQLGTASVTVCDSLLASWNITTKELYSIALANAERLFPSQIINICEILEKTGVPTPAGLHIPMYVLSNINKQEGASCILYEDVLKNFSRKICSSLYILPSSTHEVILLPANDSPMENDLLTMVKEVNATEVREDEILSDNVYFYSLETNKITPLNYI